MKAGLEKEKAALLVALAALSDGRKVVLAVTPGYRESTESWGTVLRDLRDRGLRPPRLVVGDGHLGIWNALRQVYPEAEAQRCWNHKIINVLDTLPKRQQAAGTALLRQIPAAPTRREAERRRDQCVAWCVPHGRSPPNSIYTPLDMTSGRIAVSVATPSHSFSSFINRRTSSQSDVSARNAFSSTAHRSTVAKR